MDEIHKSFLSEESDFEILTEPDDICKACPNLSEIGCQLRKDRKQELAVSFQDKKVVKALGLKLGESYKTKFLRALIKEKISEHKRHGLCGNCPWQSLCKKTFPLFLVSDFE